MLKKFPKTLNDLTGYVVYQPDNYDKTKKYPCIFLFHGIGERGDGSDLGLDNVFKFISSEWNNFMPGLLTGKFILIAPQLQSGQNWSANYVTEVLKFAANYSIDLDRRILMSISLGGQIGWMAPCYSPEFCAVVNICPIWVQSNFCSIKIPVWTFHAINDPVVPISGSRSATNAINICNPPVKAKLTEINQAMHEIWGTVLSPVLLPGESQTVWQWMEQQTKGTVPSPVPIIVPTNPPPLEVLLVTADASATVIGPGLSVTLDASKSTGYKQSGGYKDLSWSLKGWPNKGTYDVFPNWNKIGEKIKLQNLVAGEYIFELLAQDGKGGKDTDTVKFTLSASGKTEVGTGTANGKAAVLYSDNTWT